jgi:hypothetical protein
MRRKVIEVPALRMRVLVVTGAIWSIEPSWRSAAWSVLRGQVNGEGLFVEGSGGSAASPI